ncbi:pollen-specific leucine-rich repeat extensin-like protein 1 [Corylus avellana]|uniref:pollen-specific leucine-rich repeat extensin-like protein 1 n=1 Tax=Corylus avellana TaxID=13451 RepID=UPI00286D3ABC|nr:pollen-specific leucine-rich repeat extensin-like protein 1 [Corylus avellana]
MDTKQHVPANRVYEDIDPSTEWAREQDDHDTLILVLPGFEREQLKVQVTSSTRILRVSGERLLDNNKWQRFQKEFPIASNIDTNSITAKYESGMLYIKHPKVITLTRLQEQAKPAAEAKPKSDQPRPILKSAQQPPAEAPRPQQMPKSDQPRPTQKSSQQPPAEAPRPQQMPKSDQPLPTQKSAQEQAAQQVSSKLAANADKQTEGKTTAQAKGNEISEAKKDSRKTPVPEMEKELPSDHANKKQSTSSPEAEKETIRSSEKAGKVAGASEKQKTHGDAGKKEKRPITENDEQEGYTQWVYSLAMELKKPKKLVNLIVAALLVVVFVFYAKHAAKQPIREPKSKLP